MSDLKAFTLEFDGYLITTDKKLMFPNQIHKWLSEKSYWAERIPFHTVKVSIENSFCIAIIKNDIQVGFARLITDYATFGYLADVFIVDEYQGKGLGKKMMEVLFNFEWVTKLRRLMLATKDAHSLYVKSGFIQIQNPERLMEIVKLDMY